MNSSITNTPSRHHFLPEFYLKRWARPPQGRLVRYHRLPSGQVVHKWRAPKGVGCKDNLYSFPSLGQELAPVIETKLMSPLDDKAGKIMARMIESGGQELSGAEMIWWSHFLLRLLIGTPESVKSLREGGMAVWNKTNPKSEAEYQAKKGPDDPSTLEEYLAIEDTEGGHRLGLKLLNSLTMNEPIAEFIRSMLWNVVTIPDGFRPLITSDRAIFSSNGLKRKGGQIILPISPRHLFCAFYDKATQAEAEQLPINDLVDSARKLVVVRAQKEVFASTADEGPFLEQWMGYERTPSLAETMVGNWLKNGDVDEQ